jgi:hypothetical protein
LNVTEPSAVVNVSGGVVEVSYVPGRSSTPR